MNIVVLDTAASKGGALSILHDFFDYIKESDSINQWYFIVSDLTIKSINNIHVIYLPEIKKSRCKRLIFDLYSGSQIINKFKPDVVFSLQNTMVRGISCRKVLYLHNSLYFQTIKRFSFFKKNERPLAIYQWLIGRLIVKSVRISDSIIVQTKWMKEAVINKTHVNEKIVHVIHPSVQKITLSDTLLEWNKNSFFYPTSKDIYKNVDCLLNANKILNNNKEYRQQIFITFDGVNTSNVNYVNHLKREDVLAYMEKATLVFPSYIETFGLPLLEARCLGGMILAADTDFSHEILDGYENAYFFNPFRPDDLASLMKGILDGKIQRKKINKYNNFDQFNSWSLVKKNIVNIGE